MSKNGKLSVNSLESTRHPPNTYFRSLVDVVNITISKMIHSLFIINNTGDVFMEKHWKSVVNKSICDYFFEAQGKVTNPEDVPPVIATPHHYLINIYRNSLYFVAVVTTEVPPLFVVEFLHRIFDMFEDYFTECSETNLKDHFVIVYELLDEMLDNGFPLAVESNVLKELIKPPNFLRSITDTVTGKSTGVGATLPTGQLSNIPWRRTGVKYTNNEAYFDVIEEIDAIIDKSGSTVIAEIQGYIDCLIKLSGMPDLTLSFVNPRLLDDVSFHPCVRFKRWETEKILSFVPPDGHFRMMSYHIGANNMVAIPVYLRHNISFREGSGGRFDVTIGPKQTMGKTVENVVLEVPFPKSVLNVTLTANQGKNSFDPVSKLMTWDVGKIDTAKLPNIKGTITLQTGVPVPESNPTITVMFTINTLAVSGLKVNRLDMYGEKYKPFKGVKYITRAGKFQVRT
ncbi:AP-3 complex subunit mu-1 isoform X2 [Aplysia californica]|uniref:AP-3 complex subunit mu-1 isoform X2 n=1 Tax=Aplysia californica TaxID=6500 RepID=A0ABM0JD40_APLCA|nr:AP-3 complex subunit mu-1 isoform X2 [Aplysia californica]